MRFLLVAPVAEASGESLAAVAASGDLLGRGHDVAWLLSQRAQRLVPESLRGAGTRTLGDKREGNLAAWRELVAGFGPDAIVFADYPLLFLSGTACPLWRHDDELEFIAPWSRTSGLFSFDHLGLSQLTEPVRLGPLPGTETMTRPVLPPGMQVLLPCPLHDPRAAKPDRRVIACKGPRNAPPLPDAERAALRAKHSHGGGADHIILHAVPGWACKLARAFDHAYYPELGRLLVDALPDCSTLISINDGSLIEPSHRKGVEVVNLEPVATDTFDALLRSADLFVTENPISSSLGRAISSQIPACVCYVWPDSCRPGGWSAGPATKRDAAARDTHYDLFPIFPQGELRKLGVVATAGSVTACFDEVNLTNVADSRRTISRLLTSATHKQRLRAAQGRYNRAVAALPSAGMAILDPRC